MFITETEIIPLSFGRYITLEGRTQQGGRILTDKFYTYILRCRDGVLYTGYTNDVEKRLEKHNSGKGAKFTRGRGPMQVVFCQGFPNKEEAMIREAEIKKLPRQEKLEIIKGDRK